MNESMNEAAAGWTSPSLWSPVSFQATLQANNYNLVALPPDISGEDRSEVGAVSAV